MKIQIEISIKIERERGENNRSLLSMVGTYDHRRS
jgi:hypothetical protein